MMESRYRSEALARAEALRCLGCHDAPCRCGCPAGVDPRAFIRKIRFGNLTGAARLLRAGNFFYGISGYVCPSGRTCVSKCTSDKLDRPIDIQGLQRYVAEWERGLAEAGQFPLRVVKPAVRWAKRPVAVVGAGPAGLSCAAELALQGRRVVVFDAAPKAGGMMRRVIPWFRLPAEMVDYEIGILESLGVELRMGREVKDPHELRGEGFAAVFVATGTWSTRKLGIPNEHLPGVISPLELLEQARATGSPAIGSRVVVIGGGDVALDAARTAARLGARATVVYRRGRSAMPAYGQEVEEGLADGVEFLFHCVPDAILGTDHVTGIRLRRVKWESGERTALKFEARGAPLELEADTIVPAVGLVPGERGRLGLGGGEGGWLATDGAGRTSMPWVFAGGDVVSGPSTVVAAVGAGRKAAQAIGGFLEGSEADTEPTTTAEGALSERRESKGTTTINGREVYQGPRADLAVTFCGVKFRNPFVLAAAPPTDDLEMVRDAFRAGWAGAVLKTTSMEGTPVSLAYPMMSSLEVDGRRVVGLGNIDLISEHHVDVVEERVEILKREFPDRVVIASIMGATKHDWQSLVHRLEAAGADMIECSFSCPQGTLGRKAGAMLGQDAEASAKVAGWVKEAARRIPVVIKLTPMVADIVEVAQAVRKAGADGICASNTIPSLMGIDLATFIPYPQVGGKSTFSGMSGPAIKPLTLRTIAEIARRTGAPITGTGGPVTWRDAVELMAVGARNVQFCTAVMHHGIDIIDELVEGMADYLDRVGMRSATELVGRSLPHIVGHDELPRGAKVRSRIDQGLCIRCGDCVIACRDGGHRAIGAGADRAPVVDDEKCVGCGLCRLVCPVAACVRMEAVAERSGGRGRMKMPRHAMTSRQRAGQAQSKTKNRK
ncbi:MAG: NAD-dependent dihydropyrimidine dehydrogenase subunit PreA [Deltaproteobacteria bacterium]|nr:NAD-dependent dihydropyrimidine dehydrogenase subunit PreA [Deltaproteobacteria bacterium]